MTIELVSYDSLKDLLGLEGSTITDYPALNIIRLGVTSAIEEYLGRNLEGKSRTELVYVGDTPSRMILLSAIPVGTITSITETCDDTDTEYTSDDYDIVDYGIKLASKIKNSKLTIVYTGGWETADVPSAVSRAALLQTAYEFQSKEQIGAEMVSTEGGSVSRPALNLLPEVKRMLNKYKHPLRLS
jgi:hypothetical protein